MATPRSLVGWGILGILVLACAVFVSVPVAILLLAFVSGAPLFTIMLGATILGAASGLVHHGSTSISFWSDPHLVPKSWSNFAWTTPKPMPFWDEFNGNIEKIENVGLGDQVETMSTIPLFIYAGYLLAESGTAGRLVRFANAMLGWVPGGLAIVTIGTCALFTVFTGASGVTIIALGGVLMPALVKNGYPERFSMGLIAGTGSVGLLFPPALPLFIYGTVYGLCASKPMQALWDTRRFLFSGIVPGLVLIGMLSAVAVTVAIRKKLPRQKFNFKELRTSFLLALPELFVPFGVILGLVVVGFGLPEIAALTVTYTVVLEVGISRLIPGWGKPLPVRVLWTTSREAIAMIGAIFIIIFASTALTDFMVNAEVPGKIVDWTTHHVHSKIVFLLAINVILLLVGTVMDIFSAIVVVLPLLAPIAEKYGVDPYHLGVIFLLNLEVGYLHPPVGLNLFITSVKFQRPITEVMWATIPFLITMLLALLTITYVPQLTAISSNLSPYDPTRTGRIADLTGMIHSKAEEITAIKELTLVDASGAPLPGPDGKPVVIKLDDCNKVDASEREGCVRPFFDIKACKGKPDEKACTNKAIADYVVANQGDSPEKQFIVVTEVPLVSGKDIIKDKAGHQVVKKIADCEKASSVSDCRELFVNVSNCQISPPADGAEFCIKDKTTSWVDSNYKSE